MTIDPREVARWARIVSANRLICVRADNWMNCGDGGTHHGGADFCTPIGRLAEAFEDTHKGNRMDLLTTNEAPRKCAIPLLVELCAGTAALSLRLERAGARPPVSRMGAKTGYSDAILALAGLNPGDRAEHYLWCEPDDGVRLLLHAYRDAELAREAARIIRSWADEDPRELWERLRAEGPARCPPVDAREVGRWLYVTGRGLGGITAADGLPTGQVVEVTEIRKRGVNAGRMLTRQAPDQRLMCSRMAETTTGLPATIHDDATTLDPREVLGLLDVSPQAPGSDCVDGDRLDAKARGDLFRGLGGCPDGAHRVGIELCARVVDSALHGAVPLFVSDVLSLRAPSQVGGPVVVADAVEVPDDGAAGALPMERRTDKRGDPSVNPAATSAENKAPVAVFVAPASQGPVGVCRTDLPGRVDVVLGGFCDGAPFHEGTPCIPATIPYGAGSVNLDGVLVFVDPPYLNTTGYAHDLGREQVVALARRWADAGARVMISEAEPIGALVEDGWHAVEVTAMRVGQKRTFSRQQREWVTLNFEPDARAVRACEIATERADRTARVMAGGEQVGLFGGDR